MCTLLRKPDGNTAYPVNTWRALSTTGKTNTTGTSVRACSTSIHSSSPTSKVCDQSNIIIARWYTAVIVVTGEKKLITQGLDIHFYHVKPSEKDARRAKVVPLLLVHGWPGSVVEFQKIIPMLTTARPGSDYVFEVIAPSLPGYGFSAPAVRPGLGAAQVNNNTATARRELTYRRLTTERAYGLL